MSDIFNISDIAKNANKKQESGTPFPSFNPFEGIFNSTPEKRQEESKKPKIVTLPIFEIDSKEEKISVEVLKEEQPEVLEEEAEVVQEKPVGSEDVKEQAEEVAQEESFEETEPNTNEETIQEEVEETEEEVEEEKPKKKKRTRRTKAEMEKARQEEANEKNKEDSVEESSNKNVEEAKKEKLTKESPAPDYSDVKYGSKQFNYEKSLEGIIPNVVDEDFEEQKKHIETDLDRLKITSDLNEGTVRVMLATLNNTYRYISDLKAESESLYSQINERIAEVEAVNAVGKDAAERKRNSILACMNYKNNKGTFNLYEIKNYTSYRVNYFKTAFAKVCKTHDILINFIALRKYEGQ